MYQALLFFHLLSVITLMGGTILAGMAMPIARRSTGTPELVAVAQFLRRIPMLTLPGSLLAMLTGTALVWRQGYGFGTPWVSASFTIWTISFVVASFVLGPGLRTALPLLQKAVDAGAAEAPEFKAALDAPKMFWSMRVLEINALLMITMMVFKPGA